jgi:hypothetical protein
VLLDALLGIRPRDRFGAALSRAVVAHLPIGRPCGSVFGAVPGGAGVGSDWFSCCDRFSWCDRTVRHWITRRCAMNVRRITMDVDKAIQRPDLVELAEAIDAVTGVQAFNITVGNIDIETVGMDITVEGEALDVTAIIAAIENAGAAMHSIDEIVVGDHIVELVRRNR